MSSKDFMGIVVPLSILLPLIVGSIKYRQLGFAAKLIFWYLVAFGLFTGLALIIGKHYHQNNLPVGHLFTVIELGAIVFFYKILFSHGTKNWLYYSIIISFTLLCIINAFFFQSIYTYNSYTKSIEAIISILFAMKYFASITSGNNSSVKILTSPEFYFNAGFFQYFSGAFMLFVFSNFIITNLSLSNFLIIWTIHASLVLIMYLLFSIGFLLCKK
jgi:hypothetical protein